MEITSIHWKSSPISSTKSSSFEVLIFITLVRRVSQSRLVLRRPIIAAGDTYGFGNDDEHAAGSISQMMILK